MKNIITKELFVTSPENSILEGYIYLKDFQQLVTRRGDPYLSGELSSKMTIPFKIFGDVSYVDDSYKDCIIETRLVINKFCGRRQALLYYVKKCTDDRIQKEDFIFDKKYKDFASASTSFAIYNVA